jgi:sulfur carrier protein
MSIQINGQQKDVPTGLSVTQLIAHEKIKQPQMVSVEYNGDILDRDAFDTTVVKDGDLIEFLYFMGGGA